MIATGPSPSPVYAYEFDDRTAPFYFPPLLQFASLAYHTADIQYLFSVGDVLPWRPGSAERQPSAQQKADGPLRSARNRLDELCLDRKPERSRGQSLAGYRGSNPKSYYLLENIAPTGLTRQTDAQFAARHNCDFWDTFLTP